MRFWWRITRYDPAKRNKRGAYMGNTWTSISDVGQTFDDGELTLERYLAAEDAYVQAVLAFVDECQVTHLLVRALERGAGLHEGQRLPAAAISDVVRQMLREDVSCRLEDDGRRLLVDVGYDLYMYVGAAEPCPISVQLARSTGLFVDENFVSPKELAALDDTV